MSYREPDVVASLREQVAALSERVARLEAKPNPISIMSEADQKLLSYYRSEMRNTSDPAFLHVYHSNIESLLKRISERDWAKST